MSLPLRGQFGIITIICLSLCGTTLTTFPQQQLCLLIWCSFLRHFKSTTSHLLTIAVEFLVSFFLQGCYMERLQRNCLKYGFSSVEENQGRGKRAEGGEISTNFMKERLTAMTLAFWVLFVCLSFIISSGPKHCLQQENLMDIISSRHLAFPVKMADIHQAVKITEFHVYLGLMLRQFCWHMTLHNSHIFVLNYSSTAKPGSSVSSKPPVKPAALTLPCSLLGHWWLHERWLELSCLLMPQEEQWVTSTCYGDAGPPTFTVVAMPEQGGGLGVIPWPCCHSQMGWPGNCSKRGVGAGGQIMKNKEKRALDRV